MILAAEILKKNTQYSEYFDKIVGAKNVIMSDHSTHFLNMLAVNSMEVLYTSSS